MKDFVSQFKDITSLENVKYFYHVTDQDPNLILEEGLFMVEDKIYTTAIEIPKEFRDNPIEYSEGEKGNYYRKEPSIILIAIKEEDVDCLIQPSIYPPSSWNNDFSPDFYIDPKYVLGYIDTNNYEIVMNELFLLNDEIQYRF